MGYMLGLCWNGFQVLPFPLFQFQAKWIAMVLSGKVKLPPTNEMTKSIEAFYDQCEASGKPMHQWHDLVDIEVSSTCYFMRNFS